MNRQIVLKRIPVGVPTEEDFEMREAGEAAAPEGGVAVRTRYLSVDPYLRGRISGRKTYIDPIPAGTPMVSGCVGEVVESRHANFSAGDFVTGMWAWQETVGLRGEGLYKLDAAAAPVSTALGVLGMPGMTAYFGMMEICKPVAGDTVVVSGAAGAVGSYAGQIAKILGARAVGTAGGAEKCQYVLSLGMDAALDYKSGEDYAEMLGRACPNGIDCYFDNVGGKLSDAVYPLLNNGARVAICGQISQYNSLKAPVGPLPYGYILLKQARVEGFIVTRWMSRFPEGIAAMAGWLREGRLQYRETVYEGLEQAVRAFLGLFAGENTGKALVKL